MKLNCVSEDFPFKTKFSIINSNPRATSFSKITKYPKNEYNNELPDIFRLDFMKLSKKMYNNPFLNEVLPVDKKELYKNLEYSRKNILLIDMIKRDYNMSQNPEVLQKIRSENELKLRGVNTKVLKKSNSTQNYLAPKIELSNSQDDKKYFTSLRNLSKNSPKLGFKLSKEIDTSTNVLIDNKIAFSKYDAEKIQKLSSVVDSCHSGYLGNINNYDIKENYKENLNCKYEFDRKKFLLYDPITNRRRSVQPDKIYNDKWDKYSENFEILKHNLKRKGGLFSEFVQKNQTIYVMLNEEKKFAKLQEQARKEKEKIKIKKGKETTLKIT